MNGKNTILVGVLAVTVVVLLLLEFAGPRSVAAATISVATIGDLERLSPKRLSNGILAKVGGYHKVGDGGGGEFCYQAESNRAVDGGLVLCASGGGRWFRVGNVGRVLDIRYFGALGDGVNDDTDALQSALNAARGGAELLVPQGKWTHRSDLIVPNNVSVRGVGDLSEIVATDADLGGGRDHTALILGSHVRLSGIALRQLPVPDSRKGAVTSSCVCAIGQTDISVTEVGFGPIGESGGYFSNCSDVKLNRCWVVGNLSDGFHFTDGCRNFSVTNCFFEESGDDCVGIVSYLNGKQNSGFIVENCTMLDGNARAVGCVGSVDGIIRNNLVVDCAEGVYCVFESRYKTYCPGRVLVDKNIFIGCATRPGQNSLRVSACDGVIVAENAWLDCGGIAFGRDGGVTACRNVVFADNILVCCVEKAQPAVLVNETWGGVFDANFFADLRTAALATDKNVTALTINDNLMVNVWLGGSVNYGDIDLNDCVNSTGGRNVSVNTGSRVGCVRIAGQGKHTSVEGWNFGP